MIQCTCGLVNTIHSDFVQHVDKMRAWGDDSHMRVSSTADFANILALNLYHIMPFGFDAFLVLFYDRTWVIYYPARQSTGVVHACNKEVFPFAVTTVDGFAKRINF